MRKLVVVESPTKARTIKNFLGQDYQVESSFGHVRDLPKSKLGVEVERDFQPQYVIPTKARKTVNQLKKETEVADATILATDEDREGEAIAWHLVQALGLNKNISRIVFHEITKQAILEALKNPRPIDINLVDAQQARRVLDRLVGYQLSPFLWRKVARRLSAGRVQSVAVRLVVDREREIQKFKPQEYWSIEATLRKIPSPNEQNEFTALLIKKEEKPIGKFDIKTKQEADGVLRDLEGAEYHVASVERKEARRNPLPPFTTSTLQQTAWQRLRLPAKRTMQLAQQLYESGLITYHRTDSLNLSEFSLNAAQTYIKETYGAAYSQGKTFKTKSRTAQEAHEAIRPTDVAKRIDHKLYDLIWRRFIASQMAPAVFDATSVEVAAKNYMFRATGQVLKFDGFLKVYPMKFEEADLPSMKPEEILDLKELLSQQHFTQPPPRYTEATLIKALESYGIGRPSTYAPILSTIQERNYVEKDEQRRLCPTPTGEAVNDLLVEHFPEIVDVKFTANMEEDLDNIAQGKKQWVPMIREFYEPFAANLQKKEKEVAKQKIAAQTTGKACPQCGKTLLIRMGKYGKFYACSGYPGCIYTASLQENTTNVTCPKCKQGKLAAKRTKRKKIFYGCNRYPDCDFALWDKPTGEQCAKCSSLLVETARRQLKCSNSTCTDSKISL